MSVCHAVIVLFNLTVNPQNVDVQFLDICPREPVACVITHVYRRSAFDEPIIAHAICANNEKEEVYSGRIAPMIKT